MTSSTITNSDVDFLKLRSIDPEVLGLYRNALIHGYPYMHLSANCTAGREIKRFDGTAIDNFREAYRNRKAMKVLKFVPASGAASRMFKELFEYLEKGKESPQCDSFFAKADQYAFWDQLKSAWEGDMNGLKEPAARKACLRTLLLSDGLNYGALPKGLIAFHRYPDGQVRTAFEEHFYEAWLYSRTRNEAHIHFTIPEATRGDVEKHLSVAAQRIGKQLDCHFTIETSVQKPATDTPAIHSNDHTWVRDDNGNLLLRPAGHGALLENLNELNADLVFVKNIDNVVPDAQKDTTVAYKELIAGVLLEIQGALHHFLREIETGSLNRAECLSFIEKWLGAKLQGYTDAELATWLNRPIRVCGMVKNEGEPGGGPFLVEEPDGSRSLQIVEKSQVDLSDPEQKALIESASHFNPVDLVLGLRDYTGKPFDLMQFRNSDTGMVVSKNYYGRDINALELPGLWNGSMHYWHTVFVEVPIATFNPVKTVFDLLRPAHITN